MVELLAAADDGTRRRIHSTAERPQPMPLTPRATWGTPA
jgi:hypothetical protein